jgi:hypothetical protein
LVIDTVVLSPRFSSATLHHTLLHHTSPPVTFCTFTTPNQNLNMHLVHFTPALLLALACSGSALPATNFKITASDAILEAQPQYE